MNSTLTADSFHMVLKDYERTVKQAKKFQPTGEVSHKRYT